MTIATPNRMDNVLADSSKQIRKTFGWIFVLSLIQIAAGMFAISFAFSATLASIVMLGFILLVAAGAQIGAAFWVRPWNRSLLFFLLGALYAVAGFLTLRHPLLAAEGVTLMLAAAFMVGGVFRIVAALADGFPGWGWVLFNGVITLMLGILIWLQWPISGLWVLGMFLGIDLVFNGVTWAAIAMTVRSGTKGSHSH